MALSIDGKAWAEVIATQHVLVIGDIMIDRYFIGSASRISPEAPIPVVDLKNIEDRPGGAANVALNLKELGAKVSLIGLIGADEDGEKMKNIMHPIGLLQSSLVKDPSRKTTVKNRVVAQNQQLIRFDQEDTSIANDEVQSEILRQTRRIHAESPVKAIILEDYNKGLFSDILIKSIIGFAKEHYIPVFVDPKMDNFFSYLDCFLVKPNLKEAAFAIGKRVVTIDDVINVSKVLFDRLNPQVLMVTLAEKGMLIRDKSGCKIYPTTERSVKDVSGAGDTVIAVACLSYIYNLDNQSVAQLCNTAGGLVCEKAGVSTINLKELLAAV